MTQISDRDSTIRCEVGGVGGRSRDTLFRNLSRHFPGLEETETTNGPVNHATDNSSGLIKAETINFSIVVEERDVINYLHLWI